ncbi:MAG: hypothetical protein VX438_19635, partial [Planctomycetota bacterium]|nr:hypothetical protein [Planctomycetota bacterium]
MPNNFDPTIDVQDSIIRLGDSVQLTAITSVFDQDGNPFETYRFFNPVGGGFFSLSGVDMGAGVYFDVDSADLPNRYYHAGATVGHEQVTAQVYDGGRWSEEDLATFYSVTAPTRKPEISADSSFDVIANEKVKLSDYFSATDPDGYPIIRYKFKDSRTNNNGGQLETNGILRPQGQWVYVPANQLDKAYYHGALNQDSEKLRIRAFDGSKWS